jgi:hypothetical protein
VHYNSTKRTGDFDQAFQSTSDDVHHADEKIMHVRVEGEFVSGVMNGKELSGGKYIMVMDADLPYSRNIIPELVSALIANQNFIIVASRFVKDAHVRRIPFIQNAVGKTARIIARYGLKIKNVKDPTSACFAFSRGVVKDIKFEAFPLPSDHSDIHQMNGRAGEVWAAEPGVHKILVVRTGE